MELLVVVALIAVVIGWVRRNSRGRGEPEPPPARASDQSIDAHFQRLEQLRRARDSGQHDQALEIARVDIEQAAVFLTAWNRDQVDLAARLGSPDPGWRTVRFPSVEAICQLGAARRDTELIMHAHSIMASIPGMDEHTAHLAKAHEDALACQRILTLVAEEPGVPTAGLAAKVDHPHPRVRSTVHWLHTDQQVIRVRDRKTYRLYLPDDAPNPAPPPPPAQSQQPRPSPSPSPPPAPSQRPRPAPPATPTRIRFAAIDVETATSDPASICAIAVCWVDNSQIIGFRHWLVRPPANRYNPVNISIHGIRPEQTANAPTFDAVWTMLTPHLQGLRLVAHNARFDRNAINRAWEATAGTPLGLQMDCTLRAASKLWPHLPNHKLPTVSAHIGHNLTQHHDAAADAEAAARIAIVACTTAQVTDLRMV